MIFFGNGTVIRQRDPRKGVLFVLTYHPLFKSMGKIINKNLKRWFTPKPMISFRSAKKWAVILLELNYIQKNDLKVPLSVLVSVVRFV